MKGKKPNSWRRPPLAVRMAIWYVYRACAYDEARALGPEEMELDHVIPLRLLRHPAELALVLAMHGLDSTFDLFGIENLVPISSAFNKQKRALTRRGDLVRRYGAAVLPHVELEKRMNAWTMTAEEVIARGLRQARENRDAVLRMLRRTDAQERFRAVAARWVADGLTPEEMHDIAAGEEASFPRRRPAAGQESVVASEGTAYLSCLLPAFPDLDGSAVIQFATLKLRGFIPALGGRDLAAGLFKGYGAGVDPARRPILRAEKDGRYRVHLGSSTCWLTAAEARDLCAVADAAAPVWVDAARRVERDVFRSLRLPWANAGYRLYGVSAEVWRALLEFAAAHPLGSASEWHVFDAPHQRLRVFRAEADGSERLVAELHAEWDEGMAEPPRSHERVWICWDPRTPVWGPEGGARDYRNGKLWNAEVVLAWLERLIPHAWAWRMTRVAPTRSSTGGRIGALLRIRGGDPSEPRAATPDASRAPAWPAASPWDQGEPLSSPESLVGAVAALQRHFATHKEAVSPAAAAGVYRFVIWCLRNLRVTDASRAYARNSLFDNVQPSLADLEADPAAHPEAESPPGGFAMDYALRSMLDLLRNAELDRAWHDVRTEARVQLSRLMEDVETIAYLKRLEAKPW